MFFMRTMSCFLCGKLQVWWDIETNQTQKVRTSNTWYEKIGVYNHVYTLYTLHTYIQLTWPGIMELPPLLSLTHWYVHPHCCMVGNQIKTHQPTKKSTSSGALFWSTLIGAFFFCGTFSIVFQMSMLAMVPFLAAIASTHAHMKGEDISSQRSIVHLLQFMKCLNDTTKTPNPREKTGVDSVVAIVAIYSEMYRRIRKV